MNVTATTTKTVDFTSVNIPTLMRPIVARWAALCLSEVKATWPVDTGLSKASWQVSSHVEGTLASITLVNTTSYAAYVEGKKGFNGQELAAAIVAKNVPLMNLEIERAIATAMNNATRSGGSVNRG